MRITNPRAFDAPLGGPHRAVVESNGALAYQSPVDFALDAA
jgi:hypothetical protein